MFLGGSIKIKGPEFEKKDITFESKIAGEFYLEMDKAAVPIVDGFDVWVQLDKDKEIKISTDCEDEESLYNDICIRLTSGKNDIALSLSPDQAAALSQVLGHYVTAYYEAKALATERVVKTA